MITMRDASERARPLQVYNARVTSVVGHFTLPESTEALAYLHSVEASRETHPTNKKDEAVLGALGGRPQR